MENPPLPSRIFSKLQRPPGEWFCNFRGSLERRKEAPKKQGGSDGFNAHGRVLQVHLVFGILYLTAPRARSRPHPGETCYDLGMWSIHVPWPMSLAGSALAVPGRTRSHLRSVGSDSFSPPRLTQLAAAVTACTFTPSGSSFKRKSAPETCRLGDARARGISDATRPTRNPNLL